jgi:hypothetical protein
MKKIKAFSTVALLGAALMFGSCKKDECKDIVCENSGICNVGICDCATGYEGESCETVQRDKYLRTAANTEDCVADYSTDVVAGTNIDEIKIKNLGNFICTNGDYYVTIKLSGSNSFTIPSQNVCDDVYTFTGSGTYTATGNDIVVNYSAVYDDANGDPVTDACTATID